MLICLFFLLLFLTVYSYLIYPFVLLLLNFMLGNKHGTQIKLNALPPVSLIITCYNEKTRVKEKIANTLLIKYPKEKLEIIFASDCSNDGTDNIILSYESAGIKLVRAQNRLGKENAQLCAIKKASGDILVFSDVATEIPADAIEKLVRYYNDPEVGAISSEDRFISQDGDIAGEGLYVKYEMWLRQQESMLAGLVGLSGSFFSCRKEITEEWDIHSPSDFNTAINAAKKSYKAVTADDVLGFYKDLSNPKKEYQRKVRTVLRGMTGFARHLEVLNPFRYKLFTLQIISHKLMRWLVPVFMCLLFVMNLFILNIHWMFMLFFVAQLTFYLIVIAAHFFPLLHDNPLVKIMYFFVQVNMAIAHSGFLFLTGKRMTVWQPSKR